jgi:hypothetical protein
MKKWRSSWARYRVTLGRKEALDELHLGGRRRGEAK